MKKEDKKKKQKIDKITAAFFIMLVIYLFVGINGMLEADKPSLDNSVKNVYSK